MGINSRAEEDTARKHLGERMQHTADVCAASHRGDPVTPERLAEIRANDARTCGDDSLYFNGQSMVHVDRHDLLRHLDAIADSHSTSAAPAETATGCAICGCTQDEPCAGGCDRVDSTLETALCTQCAWTIARDAVAFGLYRPAPDGALF